MFYCVVDTSAFCEKQLPKNAEFDVEEHRKTTKFLIKYQSYHSAIDKCIVYFDFFVSKANLVCSENHKQITNIAKT